VNYWFWLFIILPPALVFSVKPEANAWLHVGRLAGAIALAALLNKMALGFDEQVVREIYTGCLARAPSGERVLRSHCTTLKYDAYSVRDILFEFFTWITNIGYVAACEIVRRLIQHRARGQSGKALVVKNLVSNTFLIITSPLLIALFLLICYFTFMSVIDDILNLTEIIFPSLPTYIINL